MSDPWLERRARFERNPEGTAWVFIHPCEVCGSPDAPFGYGFSARAKRRGQWRCRDHRMNEAERKEAAQWRPSEN